MQTWDEVDRAKMTKSVVSVKQLTETALDFARLVRHLRERNTIIDYSDCALPVRSTREHRRNGALTGAGEYRRALRLAGVPVHNPRSRAMLEQPEAQTVLGALLETLDVWMRSTCGGTSVAWI